MSNHKLTKGREEERLLAQAQMMAAQQQQEVDNAKRSKAFGTQPMQQQETFDFNSDLQETAAALNLPKEATQQIEQPPQDFPPTSHKEELSNQEEEEEKEEGLSDDPEERLQQVAQKIQESFPGQAVPNEHALRTWKNRHGNIFILPIDDRLFIYRYIKRLEWTNMQKDQSLSQMTQEEIDEHMFRKFVLWPANDAMIEQSLPAGAISTLVEQIKLQSMFLDPMAVAQVTIKL